MKYNQFVGACMTCGKSIFEEIEVEKENVARIHENLNRVCKECLTEYWKEVDCLIEKGIMPPYIV